MGALSFIGELLHRVLYDDTKSYQSNAQYVICFLLPSTAVGAAARNADQMNGLEEWGKRGVLDGR